MSKLSFEALRKANASRAPRWHTSPEGMMEWTIGDWFMAMAGEVGEGADELLPLMFTAFVGKTGQLGNMAKKYRRVQEGIANKSDDPERHIHADNAISKMFDEIADVQIYLDLFALRLREALNTGEDIGDHVERVFNRTSKKYGFPERLVDGKFVLATVGKFKLGEHGREYEGEIYSDPPEEPKRTVSFSLDSDANLVAQAIGGDIYSQVAEDIRRTKYRAEPWPDTLARYAAGAPYGEQPFNERKLQEHPNFFGRHLEGQEVGTAGAKIKEGDILAFGKDGRFYPLNRREGTFTEDPAQPDIVVKPDIPVVWHDGCALCRWCAMDMDMDPFCTNPEVKEGARTTIGLGLNAAVRSYCGKDGKLSLFEPRK